MHLAVRGASAKSKACNVGRFESKNIPPKPNTALVSFVFIYRKLELARLVFRRALQKSLRFKIAVDKSVRWSGCIIVDFKVSMRQKLV